MKDHLYKLRPGALTSGEPKIVWVKMLQRMRSADKVLTVRTRFNNILEELIAKERNHYLIDPNPAVHDTAFYSHLNLLNLDGCTAFWKEIDDCVKLFDHHKLNLKPHTDPAKTDIADLSAFKHRYKLPPPPPPPH